MAFGIICEYNPFHNGHLHQINEIKKVSSEPIICVMSGNFVQRGEAAVYDKYARAEMALRCGADIVLELPVPYCIASAEFFASAGVEILNRAGVDKLCFGSESADAEILKRTARIALSDEFMYSIKQVPRDRGNTEAYFDALAAAGADSIGKNGFGSNDILALEYTKAIIKNGYDMEIYPIKREGSRYGDTELKDGLLPSATALRERLSVGDREGTAGFVPEAVQKILERERPTLMGFGSNAMIFYLRTLDAERADVAISDRGLIYKIVNEANESRTYDELLTRVGTARYTASAVRRAMLYLLFDIKHSDLRAPVAYTTLLGANATGREYLANMRKRGDGIRIITKPSDAKELTDEASKRQCALGIRADMFYTLCTPALKDSGYFMRKSPIIL